MASINAATKAPPVFTHEGTLARRITPLQELIRLTMTCMLWEDNFYENGVSVADRIKELVHKVTLKQSYGVAIEARNNMKLRHVPLLIVREMARHPKKGREAVGDNAPMWVSTALSEVIQRADELTEFLAIYWKDGKTPLSKQVKLGLAKAFTKFSEYDLAKYNRDKDIKLKDVLFLCHSKPSDGSGVWNKQTREAHRAGNFPFNPTEGELLYGKLIYNQLETPDTWEVELSQSTDKAASWRRLLTEKKLGDLAFLRNLRNMKQVGIGDDLIIESGDARRWGRVLPFRFLSAARMVPQLEPYLERWMFKCLEGSEKLGGKTVLLVDVSGSMNDRLSAKSDLTRLDAAKALAILLREVCEEVRIVIFNTEGREVPPRRGFALADVMGPAGGGTHLGAAIRWANGVGYDRLIVLTDEQSQDVVGTPLPDTCSYMLNVAANRNGVGYGAWLRVDGFSEAVVNYIQAHEAQ